MLTLSGSLRALSLDDVRPRAEQAARAVGVTRVTEVTRLDRIGVPVCVAVRPTARAGSLCVGAGKGLVAAEARVGALMETVEQAWMEPGRGPVPVVRARVRELLDPGRDDAIVDLCPQIGAIIDPDAPTLAVEAHDLRTGNTTLVPAELVFHPAPPHLGFGYFGTGSNGAAAGATLAEATLHGLLEVLERDAMSFHNVRDHSRRVADDGLPDAVRALSPRLAEAGLRLIVRALPNDLDLPCFTAILVDENQPQLSIRGDGLHLMRDVALHRAVTEAAQCRLTIIHGGRDDLDHFAIRFARLDDDAREARNRTIVERLGGGPAIAYSAVHALPPPDGIEQALADLCDRLGRRGFPRILRVLLTPPDAPVVVVRVIVPGLECRLADAKRMGRRLRRFLRSMA